MNAEFIAMLDHLERERGIKRDVLIEAVGGNRVQVDGPRGGGNAQGCDREHRDVHVETPVELDFLQVEKL